MARFASPSLECASSRFDLFINSVSSIFVTAYAPVSGSSSNFKDVFSSIIAKALCGVIFPSTALVTTTSAVGVSKTISTFACLAKSLSEWAALPEGILKNCNRSSPHPPRTNETATSRTPRLDVNNRIRFLIQSNLSTASGRGA